MIDLFVWRRRREAGVAWYFHSIIDQSGGTAVSVLMYFAQIRKGVIPSKLPKGRVLHFLCCNATTNCKYLCLTKVFALDMNFHIFEGNPQCSCLRRKQMWNKQTPLTQDKYYRPAMEFRPVLTILNFCFRLRYFPLKFLF